MLVLLPAAFLLWPRTMNYTYEIGDKPLSNPLKGWVRWGENRDTDPDGTLAYGAVRWSDLEPEPGVYDFDALEENWNFHFWKDRGVHLILRVVADEPGAESHLDIPRWLYDEMEGSGTWYDSSYGRGFSPDYTHPAMIEAHRRLLEALGQRYDGDPQVAYVQLGSLGHWGEWHVRQSAGIAPFPSREIAGQYVRHYVDAFPATPLLMRRPYPGVKERGLGLYHDSLGRTESDQLQLSWVQNGYVSDQSGEEMPACPDFWKRGPSGGELASGTEMEDYFTGGFDHLRATVEALHVSWIGPKSPRRAELSPGAWENMEALAAELGYCYTLRSMTVKNGLLRGARVDLRFENLGIAPMYAAWPVRIQLRDDAGDLVESRDLPADQKTWTEAGSITCRIPRRVMKQGDLTVWMGIVDPMTDTCRVALANELPMKDGMYNLGEIKKIW